jgi:hypothetical protein
MTIVVEGCLHGSVIPADGLSYNLPAAGSVTSIIEHDFDILLVRRRQRS